MTPAPRFNLPPDLLALLAQHAARKPRPAQRADYRARMLERAQANYLRACAPTSQTRGRPRSRARAGIHCRTCAAVVYATRQ